MKKIAFLAGTVLATTVVVQTGQSQPLLGGEVTFQNGDITLNQDSLAAATSGTFDTSPPSVVSSGTGAYAGSVNDTVTWTSGALSFGLGNQSISPLWSFGGGGETFSFDLSSIASYTTTGGDTEATLLGYGTLEGSGNVDYAPTAGTFTLNIHDTSGGYSGMADFGFDASGDPALQSNGPSDSTPDGGLTVALLGGALAGLGALRRKLN